MSAHAGILHVDGSPITRSLVDALTRYNQDRGPDRHGTYAARNIVLLHWGLHLDALSAGEEQPFRLNNRQFLLWDGRLDNRDDLLLQFERELQEDTTDVALVAAAIRRWGQDAFGILVGDWSLALADEDEQRVTLARDYMGNRPLYYVQRPGKVYWSTCFRTLAHAFGSDGDMDEEYLAHALTFGPHPETTFYKSIRAVPPSHAVTLSANGRHCRRYWDFPSNTSIRYRDERDYAAHLRTLFQEAVAVRLRTSHPVWSQMSGGYDSSAITCMTHHLIQHRRVEAPSLRSISYIYSKSPESTDRKYIAAVEEWCGIRTFLLDGQEPVTLEELGALVAPFSCGDTDATVRALGTGMRGVLLSGELGDLLMAKRRANAVALTEHLSGGQLRRFVRGLLEWSIKTRTPWPHSLGVVLRPCMPAFIDERLQRRAGAGQQPDLDALSQSTCLTGDFLTRTRPHPASFRDRLRAFHPAKRPIVDGLYKSVGMPFVETPESMARIRKTYPFLHRPLVEFVLGIPQHVLWKPHVRRSLMREALGCVLPDLVLHRNNKGDASPASTRKRLALANALGNDVDHWQVVQAGYVDASRLTQRLQEARSGKLKESQQLSRIFALEAWLRSHHTVSAGASHASPFVIAQPMVERTPHLEGLRHASGAVTPLQ